MTMAESLAQLKIDVNDIFASKSIGASQTKGINDTFDALIAASKAQEIKLSIKTPPVASPKK